MKPPAPSRTINGQNDGCWREAGDKLERRMARKSRLATPWRKLPLRNQCEQDGTFATAEALAPVRRSSAEPFPESCDAASRLMPGQRCHSEYIDRGTIRRQAEVAVLRMRANARFAVQDAADSENQWNAFVDHQAAIVNTADSKLSQNVPTSAPWV